MAFTPFDFPDCSSPVPFKLELKDDFLKMTLDKVATYRPTADFGGDSWSDEGPPSSIVASIASDWLTKFSWKDFEAEMNSGFKHFATKLPANAAYDKPIPVHFIHHRSSNPGAIPLILLHGWPSSFLEWSKVIEPLSEQFHVVAPDLPGFGFSPAPQQPMTPEAMALAFKDLMQQLGYSRYAIISTDQGWSVGLWMLGPQTIGHFSDFYVVVPTPADRARIAAKEATAEESAYVAAFDTWYTKHWAYATTHEQKPLALAFALNDSPVGLLSWILDLVHTVADGREYSPEELIVDAMMLWIPGVYNGIRLYRESAKPSSRMSPPSQVPTAVSQWSWENGPYPDLANIAFVPKDWLRRRSNITYFARHNDGGHFPALNNPVAWMKDVQAFLAEFI